MRLERMSELCRQLGIPRRTFQDWVKSDPELAVWREGGVGGGSYWIRIDRLAEKLGSIEAYTLRGQRWIRASRLAKAFGISRFTMLNWCQGRPGFAKRIGRNYYVDLEQFGATAEQVDELLGRLNGVGDLGHREPPDE